MKKCVFCSEDIQDAAIRCKHCGGDIAAAEAAAAEVEAEKGLNWALGIFFGIVGAAIFGFFAYRAFVGSEQKVAMVIGGFAAAFLVVGPVASRLGDAFRQAVMPDVVFARSASELAGQQLFWSFGPQTIGAVAAFIGMAVLLTKVVPMEDIVNEAFGSAPAKTAQVAEVQNEPTSPVVPVEADKSSDRVVAQQQAVTVPNPVQPPAVQESAAPAQVMPAPEAKEEPATAATVLARPEKSVIEASFDCGRAASKIEKLICSTPETAAADRRLAKAYGEAKAKSTDINALKAQQVEWMKQERNACTDSACLLKAVNDRIQKLAAS
ncbi:lysozyme inhibitor LprI family protein [Cupriavidus sp. BIC8F]|uniref:lysozyme inhibitor LprI family protein n=1 Tax=Cupriavidus sp. BIC8F TaxID=3079014 RepID=UPI002916F90B|nr:lysozyme inhibitor LprI family protein [Cupriavidus sp. BIC8F]